MGNLCSGDKPVKPKKRNSNTSILNPISNEISNEKKLYLEYLYPAIEHAIRNNNERNEMFISLKLPTYSNNNYKEFLEIINSGIYSKKVITVIHISIDEVILTLEA
jgi:adenosine deaminase